MTCAHPSITFTNKFGRRGNECLAEISGHCAICKAPLVFKGLPSLSPAGDNFQMPFTYGPAPGQQEPTADVIALGGRRAVN